MTIESLVTGVVMTAGAAAAATGGMVAGENQTVVTGDSSASVQVTNVVNADGSGGSSYTEIIKTVDGNTTKEVKEETFAPGEPVVVKTVVEAASKGIGSQASSSDTTILQDIGMESAAVASTAASSSPVSPVDAVVALVSRMFSSLLSLFW
jgi:hypothetical protein